MLLKCRKLSSLYSEVRKELSEIGIHNLDSYISCRNIGDYFAEKEKLTAIEVSFAQRFGSLLKDHLEGFYHTNGLAILVKEKMPNLSLSDRRKLCAFSRSSIVRINSICDEEIDHDITGSGRTMRHTLGPDISSCLQFAYQYRLDIKKKIFTPIPENIEVTDISNFDKHLNEIYHKALGSGVVREVTNEDITAGFENFNLDREDPADYFDMYNIAPDLIEDTSDYEALDVARKVYRLPSHIFSLSLGDKLLGTHADALKLGLLLPSLDALPLPIVMKLREDYRTKFVRFQKALKRMSYRFRNEPDEHRFPHILEEIEDEINALNCTYREIKRWHRRLSIPLGFIGIVFYIAAKSPELVKHLHAIFSGIATATLIEYFRDIRDVRRNVESSPFYFPLLLTQFAGRRSRRKRPKK
jgi:hypothetical protein